MTRDPETEFYIAQQVRDAASDAERAAMLLRLPDSICWEMGGQIAGACAAVGFRAGLTYLMARIANFVAVRWENGLPPAIAAAEVEKRRQALCVIAGVAP